MSKIYKVGDQTRAACDKCESFVDAVFELRDVPMSDNKGLVKNVMAGVCPNCDEVVIIPHQSTPMIRSYIESKKKPLESRVPAHMIDILNLASMEVGAMKDFGPTIIKHYLHELAESKFPLKKLAKFSNSDLATGKAQRRISIKGERIIDDSKVVMQKCRITNTTDLIKSIVLLINEEILEKKNQKTIKTLKAFRAISI